jgi:hypothetical protein
LRAKIAYAKIGGQRGVTPLNKKIRSEKKPTGRGLFLGRTIMRPLLLLAAVMALLSSAAEVRADPLYPEVADVSHATPQVVAFLSPTSLPIVSTSLVRRPIIFRKRTGPISMPRLAGRSIASKT